MISCKNRYAILGIISFIFLHDCASEACTTFIISQNDKILLAKNLDWNVGDGMVFINSRGIKKSAFVSDPDRAAKWTSVYGSISFNQLGKEFPLGGMNEAGLVIEELNYSPSRYPAPEKMRINELQWIQYHLDISNSVNDVIKSLDTLSIIPFMFKLHYMVADSRGNMAIVEFIDGTVTVHKGSEIVIPVLSNNRYSNLLKYIKHYNGFGGERIARHNRDSQERFVRAATLLRNLEHKSEQATYTDAFIILDSVRQQDTQWSIVYDISEKQIYYITRSFPKITKLSIGQCDFVAPTETCPISSTQSINSMPKFFPYTDEKNKQLLETVFKNLIVAGEVEATKAQQLSGQIDVYLKNIK